MKNSILRVDKSTRHIADLRSLCSSLKSDSVVNAEVYYELYTDSGDAGHADNDVYSMLAEDFAVAGKT